jgi:hypothetical protein
MAARRVHSPCMQHDGGCHCGNLRVRLRLSMPPAESELRACACTFCRAHAARTIADPSGLAEITARDWSRVEPYRFGTRTADYLICSTCGVYIGAVCETASGLRAVININSLDDSALFKQTPVVHDYDGESPEARLVRRASRWMPAIVHRQGHRPHPR